MADIYSKQKRSQIMASVSGKETKPEIIVRKYLFKQGYRYRKNVKTLPGKPDIVLPKYKAIIFVHGCFWHQHKGCKRSSRPTSNIEFWNEKLNKNIERDTKNTNLLEAAGWKVIVVWQCELKNIENLLKELVRKISKD